MKLMDVPRHTKIRVLDDNVYCAFASTPVEKGEIIQFNNLGGLFSHCFNKDGETVHISVLTNVEIVEDED